MLYDAAIHDEFYASRANHNYGVDVVSVRAPIGRQADPYAALNVRDVSGKY